MMRQTTTNLINLLRTCLNNNLSNNEFHNQLHLTRNGRRYLQSSSVTLFSSSSSLEQRQNRHYSFNAGQNENEQQKLLTAQNAWHLDSRSRHTTKLSFLNKQNAQDLIWSLTDSERETIKEAIAKHESSQMKKGFEGQLAAIQWRTKFGRLSSTPSLGNVDPTGTFCAFPDDWLKKKMVENAKDPTKRELCTIFAVNSVPFFVFGFLDNFTMIIAGDWIEFGLGSVMTLSTMAAAGLGNTISDILGMGSAVYVERGCMMVGLKPPNLTPGQFDLPSSRNASYWGRIIGMTIGCLVGMVPLLFVRSKENVCINEADDKNKATVENHDKNRPTVETHEQLVPI